MFCKPGDCSAAQRSLVARILREFLRRGAQNCVGTRIVQRRQRLAPIEPEFASADVFERENVL